jgi:hypothetical protein
MNLSINRGLIHLGNEADPVRLALSWQAPEIDEVWTAIGRGRLLYPSAAIWFISGSTLGKVKTWGERRVPSNFEGILYFGASRERLFRSIGGRSKEGNCLKFCEVLLESFKAPCGTHNV